MHNNYLLLIIISLMPGCGIYIHNSLEKMPSDQRIKYLNSMSTDELCGGFNNPLVKPETEKTIRNILIERGQERCDARGKVKIVYLKNFKPYETSHSNSLPDLKPVILNNINADQNEKLMEERHSSIMNGQKLPPIDNNFTKNDYGPPIDTPPTPLATPSVSSEAPARTFVEANFKANYLLNPKPKYPTIAKSRGWQGKVMLRVQVSSEGTVSHVSVETSSGHEMLDESALEAVNKWKFIPAKRGDNAVASWVIVPINFTLTDEPEKSIEAPTQEINKQNFDIKSQVKIKKHSTDKKEATKKITKENSKKTEESSAKENIEPQKNQDIKENQQSLDKKEPIKIKSFFDL